MKQLTPEERALLQILEPDNLENPTEEDMLRLKIFQGILEQMCGGEKNG